MSRRRRPGFGGAQRVRWRPADWYWPAELERLQAILEWAYQLSLPGDAGDIIAGGSGRGHVSSSPPSGGGPERAMLRRWLHVLAQVVLDLELEARGEGRGRWACGRCRRFQRGRARYCDGCGRRRAH